VGRGTSARWLGGMAIALGAGFAFGAPGVAHADDGIGAKPAAAAKQDRAGHRPAADRRPVSHRSTPGRVGAEAGTPVRQRDRWTANRRGGHAKTPAVGHPDPVADDPVPPAAAATADTAPAPARAARTTDGAGARPGPALGALAADEPVADLPPHTTGITDGVITGCVAGPSCTSADGWSYAVVAGPSRGGTLQLNGSTGAFTFLPFAPETSTDGPSGRETFTVAITRHTELSAALVGVPLLGELLFAPMLSALREIPLLGAALAPLIGAAAHREILVDVDALRGAARTPVAYTTMVTSWDGILLRTNFFPAITTGNPDDDNPGYETILYAPGLAQPGVTDPAEYFLSMFRSAGFNVVTWDPRGEFGSGGALRMNSPQYEGQDVSQLITWLSGLGGVELDRPGDPRVGMIGWSYGGGVQLIAAAGDNRVDAIAPGATWNSLVDSLYPTGAFKTAYASLLGAGLLAAVGRNIDPNTYHGILLGAWLGILTPEHLHSLQTSGPGQTVRGISVPTLLIQGTVDTMFPLHQAVVNARLMALNEHVKMIWYCGGHGTCLQGDGVADYMWMAREALAWMKRYVKEDGTTDENVFEWTDQNGDRWTSRLAPHDAGFYDAPGSVVPTTMWRGEKFLPIIPLIGGSGPNPAAIFPLSLADGTVAFHAATVPLRNPDVEIPVVGAPRVVIEYQGVGLSRHIYAQVIDRAAGVVVGNVVTPVPIILDGQLRTVTVDLNEIAYTMGPDSDLAVQVFTSATAFFNRYQYGLLYVTGVEVTLPTTSQATNQGPNPGLD